jgi:hypothetical protein
MRTPQPESKEDFIQPVPQGVEAWSENIFFFPFDYGKKVGIFSHLGRSFQDPHLWREYIHVLLPGGRALLSKSFGTLRQAGSVSARWGWRCLGACSMQACR